MLSLPWGPARPTPGTPGLWQAALLPWNPFLSRGSRGREDRPGHADLESGVRGGDRFSPHGERADPLGVAPEPPKG